MKKFYSLSSLILLLVFCGGALASNLNPLSVNKNLIGINEVPVSNLQFASFDQLTGAVQLAWQCTPSAGFLNYTIQRDGIQIATVPSQTFFDDILPTYGIYSYSVTAIYATGPTAPAYGIFEWSAPNISWSPTQLSANLLSGNAVNVPFTIGNTGLGMLAYDFPAYTDTPGDSPLAYCPASANVQDEFISKVQFATINNPSAWNGYNDYTSISTDLVKGHSYPVEVFFGPLYSGDMVGIWIDFDHSNSFDTAEFTALSIVSTATGTITVPLTALTGATTMRVRLQYNGTLSPCDTTQYGEVEDYTVIIHEPTFINNVSPASGFVSPGANQFIHIQISAFDEFSAPGVYTDSLVLHSNDTANPSITIPITMIVGSPGIITGVVSDAVTGEPLSGATVQAGSNTFTTNDVGVYSMQVWPATYTLSFSKLGYQTLYATCTVAANGTSTLNAQLFEIPYPPVNAHASVNFNDSECTVSWGAPVGLYEMMYDDGTPENYAAWEFAGNRNAVKFTPQGYPATITGAKIYICNTGFGNPIGSNFSVLVCKPDAAGMPGEVLDSVSATVNTTGLVSVTGLDAMVTTGDFFMVMVQTTPQPNCPYVGVDETLPTAYKSYSQDVLNGGAWALSAYQDFMIHAIVSGPASGGGDKMESKAANLTATNEMKAIINTPVEGFDNSAGVFKYSLSQIFLGATNPVTPPNGVMTLLNNVITSTTYIAGGSSWHSLPQGWFCYGIRAVYTNGQVSGYAFSNYVQHKYYADLTIHALLGCDSVPAEGAIVKLSGAYYPYYTLTDTLPASGTLTFSQIIQGDVTLTITYPGYNTYTQAISLTDTLEVNAVLGQALNKPTNLHVALNTLQANWQQPRGILMSQDFEGSQFPPMGWQVNTQGVAGWVATTNGSSDSLAIPPHTKYAVVNDELGGPTNNGCCDYLITPAIDLRGAPDYTLTFNSFYNGFGNQLANVEMSTDSGVSWIPIYTCQLANQWYRQTVDLSPYSGAGGLASVKFAFHANDAGNQASGWAIDDVSIDYGGLAVSGYKVYLDGAEVGQTVETHWDFDPLSLLCGQAYQVGVSAIYCSGESDIDTLGFTNYYAYPPTNLSADTIVTATSGAVMLSWDTPLYCMANAVYFHIYRDDVFLTQVPLTDTTYLDLNLMPTSYCYTLTTVYDLTPFGFPGLLAESIKSDTACADIIYGGDLPFGDDFSSGGFDTTMWNPGQNWLVDEDSDNPVPAAKFRWDPLMTNYSSALQSTMINISGIDTVSPFKIYFNYEIKLQDSTSTGNEKLAVEVWDGSGWSLAKEYTNSGSFDWTWEHLEITDLIGDYAFMVRFRANGDSSSGIRYWAIDNVHIYYTETYFLPPMILVVNPSGSFGNENHLIWEPPYTGSSDQSYILDDNTVEFSTSYNATGECWLGNEFQVSETGLLHSVSLFMEANNGTATYSISIFDENHDSLYSSAPFTPAFGTWANVELPFVEFNGPFFVMLHMLVTGNSDFLALDQDGPNTAQCPAWYTDNLLEWIKLSDLGFEPSVAFIRAHAITGDKKKSVTLNPGPVVSSPGSAFAPALVSKPVYVNTGSEVSRRTMLPDNSETLHGYNIYRRAYAVFPAGPNTSGTGVWTLINPVLVTQTEYLDQNLSNLEYNCYEYRVTAQYEGDESMPTDRESGCIFTDLKPDPANQVNLYPNPASTFISIKLNGDFSNLNIINSLGILVLEKNIAGESSLVLNTSDYVPGLYTARFSNLKGEWFSRKFIIAK